MKKIVTILGFSLFALVLTSSVALAAMTSGDGYQIWADVISVGGIEQSTSSGGFFLDDTLGEPIVGRSSTTNNTISVGFQEMVKGDILSLSVAPTFINLGTLSTTSTASGNHILYLECNAASGVTVSYTGSVLTSGSYTIPSIGNSATTPSINNSQFGFNAIHSAGGTDSSSVAPYSSVGQYAFDSSGDVPIITAAGAMGGEEEYTVTYIANISGSQAAGNYASAVTYTALASF